MSSKVLILAKLTKGAFELVLLCLLVGCGDVVESSWQPHVIAMSYSRNSQLMKEVTENDSPFPSIDIEEGDRLEFHSFTCQLFPTKKTTRGVYIIQKRDLPPIPEGEILAEMRVLVTPPARYGIWAEEYDDKDTLMTDWVPLQEQPWKIPALKQPLIARTKWYYLKVQAQVRRQRGEVVNVEPAWYIRFHTPGWFGH